MVVKLEEVTVVKLEEVTVPVDLVFHFKPFRDKKTALLAHNHTTPNLLQRHEPSQCKKTAALVCIQRARCAFCEAVSKILSNSGISQFVTCAFCESCRSRARCACLYTHLIDISNHCHSPLRSSTHPPTDSPPNPNHFKLPVQGFGVKGFLNESPSTHCTFGIEASCSAVTVGTGRSRVSLCLCWCILIASLTRIT